MCKIDMHPVFSSSLDTSQENKIKLICLILNIRILENVEYK